ncbi:MAG TPA: DUF1641 domain-containing protein [Symbiobacteriaceae bacterium]|nr:DUF1641 domain-containing protein [Symbiobacteriaceae bacterium]
MEEKQTQVTEIVTSPEVLALLEQVRTSAPALTHALRRVEELHQSGALDTLLDMAQVLQAAKVSVGDPMIHRMGNMVRVMGELVDVLMVCGLPEKLPALMQAAEGAKADADTDERTIGVIGLMKALRQPEMQFVLKFMLALSRRLPEAAK